MSLDFADILRPGFDPAGKEAEIEEFLRHAANLDYITTHTKENMEIDQQFYSAFWRILDSQRPPDPDEPGETIKIPSKEFTPEMLDRMHAGMRNAVDTMRALAEAHPELPGLRYWLAFALACWAHYTPYYEEPLRELDQLVRRYVDGPYGYKLVDVYWSYISLHHSNHWMKSYEALVAHQEKLAADFPERIKPSWLTSTIASSIRNIYNDLIPDEVDHNNDQLAEEFLRRVEELAEAHPDDEDILQDLAQALSAVGIHHKGQRLLDTARRLKQMTEGHPDNDYILAEYIQVLGAIAQAPEEEDAMAALKELAELLREDPSIYRSVESFWNDIPAQRLEKAGMRRKPR